MHESQHTAEFVQLLTSHQRRLHRYIAVFLPQAADAEDVLQKTNAVIWAKSDQFQPDSSFLAWARAIARLKIIEYCRRRKHRHFAVSPELLDTLTEHWNDEDSEDRRPEAMRRCIEKLPSSDRRLLDERYRDGATVLEVAQRQQRQASSVYRSLERIRTALLECVNRTLAQEERGR